MAKFSMVETRRSMPETSRPFAARDASPVAHVASSSGLKSAPTHANRKGEWFSIVETTHTANCKKKGAVVNPGLEDTDPALGCKHFGMPFAWAQGKDEPHRQPDLFS
jgi:hypothetical protein